MLATSVRAWPRRRDAGEQRPRLRLAEDHADAELAVARVAARVPAPAGPLALRTAREPAPRSPRSRRANAVVAAHVGELGQARVDVGESGR